MDNRMNPPTSSQTTQSVKILVVDDHPMIRRGIASLINASEGLECVAEAVDGIEALDICAKTEVDIVLMDMIMPRMDGASATQAIRQAPKRSRLDPDQFLRTGPSAKRDAGRSDGLHAQNRLGR
jgi:CheY-like chemotaxis protein